jgi:hypothetical protein
MKWGKYTKMKITLNRLTKDSITPTFGVLLTEDKIPFALTLERPWLENRKNLSCIPIGIYGCTRINSPKFGETFMVMNVLNRSEILFHKGNIDDDTHGCILVGEQFEQINKEAGIIASKHGFEEFMAHLTGINSFSLEIKDSQ